MDVSDVSMPFNLVFGSDVAISDYDFSLLDDMAQPCSSNSGVAFSFDYPSLKSASLESGFFNFSACYISKTNSLIN